MCPSAPELSAGWNRPGRAVTAFLPGARMIDPGRLRRRVRGRIALRADDPILTIPVADAEISEHEPDEYDREQPNHGSPAHEPRARSRAIRPADQTLRARWPPRAHRSVVVMVLDRCGSLMQSHQLQGHLQYPDAC